MTASAGGEPEFLFKLPCPICKRPTVARTVESPGQLPRVIAQLCAQCDPAPPGTLTIEEPA